MDLSLKDAEVELLARLLTQSLSEMRMEISNTENFDMREGLKTDEEMLKSVLRRLNPSAAL